MNKNKFAVTPPMGWNSYDYYDTTVTEEQVKANADYMAAHLKEFGWEYVVVDIEWYSNDAGTQRPWVQYIPFGDDEMDEYGRFQPSPSRFPSSAGGKGFKELADYVHSLGLKFGIHIMRGIPRKAAELHCPVLGSDATANQAADPNSICPWNPDMYGVRPNEAGQAYYDSIVSMYADWGVDYIKCDDICDNRLYRDDSFTGWEETRMLHRAIMKTGRPAHIDRAWEYGRYANMWRITDDFWDEWEPLKVMFWRCELWQDHVKEGCFPDCDMLPLGRLGKGFKDERETRFTWEEQKTMMTLWCMFRSPLMIGAEMPLMDERTLSLLTNRELLAMLGESCRGTQISRSEKCAVWKNVDGAAGKLRVALFNLADEAAELSVSFEELMEEEREGQLYEIWDKSLCDLEGGLIKALVPAHGVKVFEIR